MHTIVYSLEFPAGHFLPGYDGKCNRPHGHNYNLQVEIKSSQQDHNGMLVKDGVTLDFGFIKRTLELVVPDHEMLNDWMSAPPSTENLARELFHRLRAAGLPLDALMLWETGHSGVRYEPGIEERIEIQINYSA
jgi:6-pyruvoyltetrahydropterin/6-carboxytetrahydropterin synthase